MPHLQPTEPEPAVQAKFSFGTALAAILLFAAVVRAHAIIEAMPNQPQVPRTAAQVSLQPVGLTSAGLAPLELVGAWQLTSAGARIAGVSGMAAHGDELVAITDIGTVIRMPKQLRGKMAAIVFSLPAGPGDGHVKSNRDAEAILRDPAGRGWWVAFERHDELWLYDGNFSRALGRAEIPDSNLGNNTGIEGLAAQAGAILAFPESGREALRFSGGRWDRVRLEGSRRVSDAVALDGGLMLLVERRLTLTGFHNALALMDARGPVLKTVWRRRLPVGWRDNIEAIAAERTAGGYRLWLATDDNFHPRLRTLLMVIDVPAAALPGRG